MTKSISELTPQQMEMLSPMMQHYIKTKNDYPGCIVFYRLGDFYEMFFEDAVTVSRELELTLTGKMCGLEERAPMCGVPFHAVDGYLTRLVSKGYSVAICEQLEDPKTAKGIVKRDVIRIVTPGTNLDMNSLDETRNNYILCVFYTGTDFGPEKGTGASAENNMAAGIAACDLSTGDFRVTQVRGKQKTINEILQYQPSEIICDDGFMMSIAQTEGFSSQTDASIHPVDASGFEDQASTRLVLRHFKVPSLQALSLDACPLGRAAAGALLKYLYDTQENDLSGITALDVYTTGKFMLLDNTTRRSLEITETIREKQKRGSLLWVMDRTVTAMGARTLRSWLEQPLLSKEDIIKRQDAVETLCNNSVDRDEIREYLQNVYDLERLMTRISYLSANARDLIALRSSLAVFKPVRMLIGALSDPLLTELKDEMEDFSELKDLLERAIEDDPPLTLHEGGFIRDGYNEDVDRFRNARTSSRQWLLDLEEEDRERTGIRNLKIKYNKVFGYYFDVTNSYKSMVPDDYIRKQTLVGSERYTTEKLKNLEDTIINAQDKLYALEYELFTQIRDRIASITPSIQGAARALAALDVLCAMSVAAERNGYVRPSINEKGLIRIAGGRHPVVEQMLQGEFVDNDTLLDMDKRTTAIITGPNMAGKSTYMRQVALIVLMAQTGSFVPAREADLCIVDRIFTRVGASDDLGSGQSTFMVEMNEVASIIRNATKNSLLILDEIGRGTSTYDGLAIAWAVIEHISSKRLLGAKTLFATHYHELTELEGKLPGVNNYCIAVKENGDDIVFLRKIIPGGADRSYGIQVARLAGIPDMVIDRAKEILGQLTENDIAEKAKSIDVSKDERTKKKGVHYDEVDLSQMSLFDTVDEAKIADEIRALDIGNLTPVDALNTLYRLQNELKNTWRP